MTRHEELSIERAHFDSAMRAFKQNPTPPMSSVLKRIAGRIKYLKSCIKKGQP